VSNRHVQRHSLFLISDFKVLSFVLHWRAVAKVE